MNLITFSIERLRDVQSAELMINQPKRFTGTQEESGPRPTFCFSQVWLLNSVL